MLKKLKIKYYFWKLNRKKMDLQSVALKLSVSIEDVKTHYNRYKDPFKPIKVEPIFSFLAVCISIGSIFLSIETLDEMKKERELAYKPDLRVYENDISLYWNEKGEQTKRLDSYSRQYQTNKENVLYAVYLNIDNIGTGNAKDIKYNWNYEEIIYVFLTIFLYLLKCPQSLILSALRAFCFCGKPHISRSIFLYFLYQTWLKSW